jgi:hypothetical protein
MKGRPVQLAFSGLFLPSFEWEMKAEETPMRDLEHDPAFGTLFRNVRRRDLSEQNISTLESIRSKLETRRENPLAVDLLAALDGCQEAIARLNTAGEWALAAGGFGDSGHVVFAEYVRLEALSAAATRAVRVNDFQGAAACVCDCPELRIFWRHGSLDRLAAAETAEASLFPRLVAYLEVQMSCLAKFSLSGGKPAMAQRLAGPFEQLLRDRPAAPGGQWIRCLQHIAGTGSMAKLLELAISDGSSGDDLPSEATFKRWCSGAVFPPEDHVVSLVEAVARATRSTVDFETKRRALEDQFVFARRVNAALQFASLIVKPTEADEGINPHLGAESPIAWAQASFQHWVDHWRQASASGGAGSGT